MALISRRASEDGKSAFLEKWRKKKHCRVERPAVKGENESIK